MDTGWIEVLNLEILVHRQNKDIFFFSVFRVPADTSLKHSVYEL